MIVTIMERGVIHFALVCTQDTWGPELLAFQPLVLLNCLWSVTTLSVNFLSYYFYLLIIFPSHLLILEQCFPTCKCRSCSMGSLHPSGHQALSVYGTVIYLTHIRTPCSQENGNIVITSKVHMYLTCLLKYLLVFLLYIFSINIHSRYNHF